MRSRDSGLGRDWLEVEDAVLSCDVFLVLVCRHSNKSKEVRFEVETAALNQIPIVVVRLEDVTIPYEFLRDRTRMDYWSGARRSLMDDLAAKLKDHAAGSDALPRASAVAGIPIDITRMARTPIRMARNEGWPRPNGQILQRSLQSLRELIRPVTRFVRPSTLPFRTVDDVSFSVTAPSRVLSGAVYVVELWAHHPDEIERVMKLAKEGSPDIKIQSKSKGPTRLRRGAMISIALEIEDMSMDSPVETIIWRGHLGRATFLVSDPNRASLGPKRGKAKVFVKGLEIARVHFVIEVVESSPAKAQRLQARIRRYKKGFASYASSDRDEVLRCIQGIQKIAPEMEVFLDVLSLRSGQNWQDELWKVIPKNDVFYLFWSVHAAASEWVDKEWRCAFKTRGPEFIDPVPLCPPHEAPPPSELANKHFNDWTLAFRRRRWRSGSRAASGKGQNETP